MKTPLSIAIVATIVVSSLFGASLGKYRNWPTSPQGYFMTEAERAAWSKLTREQDAARFIADFLAKRPPSFADEVAAAAKQADEHLTIAERRGSTTLRGRIVIVLGPPTTVAMNQQDRGADPLLRQHQSLKGPSQFQPPTNLAPLSELRAKYSVDYTFTYGKSQLPGGATEDETLIVSVNPTTGDDRILDAKMARRVDELLEAAAEAKISK